MGKKRVPKVEFNPAYMPTRPGLWTSTITVDDVLVDRVEHKFESECNYLAEIMCLKIENNMLRELLKSGKAVEL